MDPLNNIFKKLSHETMRPSDGVWKEIYANQQKKRKKTIWYFGTSIVALLLIIGGLYTYINKEQPQAISTKISEPKEIKNETNTNTNLVVSNSIQNNEITPAGNIFSSINYIPNKQNSNTNTYPIEVLNTSTLEKNNSIKNIKNTKLENVNNIHENNSETKETIKEVEPVKTEQATITPYDSVIIEKPIHNNSNKPLIIDTRKKKETSKRKTYIQPSLFLARTFRTLNTNNDSFDYYKKLRNASEISGNQLAFSLSYIVEYSKNLNIQYGIMYQTQKQSSSYTWQQVKTIVVIDSIRNRDVYDSATSTWITKTDSFTHNDKKYLPVIANGDVSFSYIKLPIIVNYEFSKKKITYYIGSGFSLNILTTSIGTIRNFDLQNEGDPLPVKDLHKSIIGLDFIARFGARFQLKERFAFQIGLASGYSLSNAFTKSYPLEQHNYWYGIESGFKWSLK